MINKELKIGNKYMKLPLPGPVIEELSVMAVIEEKKIRYLERV